MDGESREVVGGRLTMEAMALMVADGSWETDVKGGW